MSFDEGSMTLFYNLSFFHLQTLYQLATLSTEAVSLLQDLQSRSKTFTLFVPVNNAVNSKVTVITVFSQIRIHSTYSLIFDQNWSLS